ncbi:hypothetical protein Vretimale_17362, partial [Volvox reticuliferus]
MALGPEHQQPSLSQHQQMTGRGASAATATAAAVAAANDGGDDTTAPRRTTSSVISLLHTLVIHQEQQRQQQEQQQQQRSLSAGPGPAAGPAQGQGPGRGIVAPSVHRLAELAELVGAADAAMAGERHGRAPGGRDQERERERLPVRNAQDLLNDPRMAAVAAAMAAAGYSTDGGVGLNGTGKTTAPRSRGCGSGASAVGAAAAAGGGGVNGAAVAGGSAALHREVSHGSRDGGGGAPGAIDLAQLRLSDVRQLLSANAVQVQVQADSSQPPALLRTISGMGEAQAFLHSAAAARSATAAAGGPVPERSDMDIDVPLTATAAAAQGGGLPHKTAADSDRIHASLAAIERKLLLQEERLVYELKQVRLMQKLLQVQQMKQMVREAMRGKDREAAAAAAAMAAGVGGGPDGSIIGGASSPFPTAAALADGGEGSGLARLSSFPSQVLVAAARAMAAGGGAAGALVRDRDRSGVAELLRSTSEPAAAAAAAASLQAGLADHPNLNTPHYQSNPPAKQAAQSQSQRRGHPAAAEASADADNAAAATDEAWSLLGPDNGHLLSYIAALSGNKATPPAALAAIAAAAARREAAGAASTTAVGGPVGVSE